MDFGSREADCHCQSPLRSEVQCNCTEEQFSDIIGDCMGLNLTLLYPYVWLKPATALDSIKQNTYILVCVDYILIVDKYPSNHMAIIKEKYTVNPGRISKTGV